MKARLIVPLTKEEFDEAHGSPVPIHKHWHEDGGIVELYIVDESEEELEDNWDEYVSPSTDETHSLNVIPLEQIDWDKLEESMFVTPENPGPEEYQFIVGKKHKIKKQLEEDN